MSESTSHSHGPESNELPRVERVKELVTQLGAGWARYGLTMGRLALQQSARALETTSALLGEVATKLEKVEKAAGDKSH